MKYFILFVVLTLISITIYWYYNPTVKDKDFHLEFELSDSNQNYQNYRNTSINKEEFSYNNEVYYNDTDNYKLTLYSLNFTEKGERIIIVTDYLKLKNKRVVNVTYKNKLGNFSPIIIKNNKDSIFIIQDLENITENNIIFKGKK